MVKAKKFDAQFDQGKDVSGYLDLRSIKIHHPVQRINVDIPKDLLQKVDEEAARIGVPRTSLLKLWIAERLEHLAV
ncbi:MAG: CopG family transcriptional regulator [Candidatus Omnitrophica bacterium]|nr:CopG family transcriptional regulator [Candidatus Omnitrophota bacterium]